MKTAHLRTRILFSGMARPGDVRLAAELGVDAVSFNFSADDPARLHPEQARALRLSVMPFVTHLASFRDNSIEDVRDVVRILRPNALEFTGAEDDVFCRGFGLPYIKAIDAHHRPGAALDIPKIHALYPHASAFRVRAAFTGPDGRPDWSHLPTISSKPLLISGGLQPAHIYDLVQAFSPWGVGVGRAIEAVPGRKDGEKMRAFVAEVRRADCDNEHESGVAPPGNCH